VTPYISNVYYRFINSFTFTPFETKKENRVAKEKKENNQHMQIKQN